MPELPAVLGSEVAGELDGNRVMGFVRTEGGGYAERVAVDRRWLLPLPAGASFAEGAAFPMAFLTAWIPLTQLLKVALRRARPRDRGGGRGRHGGDPARAGPQRPAASPPSAARRSSSSPRSLGAVEAVTYEGIGELEPVDAVFDLVGGDVFTGLALARSSRWAPRSRSAMRAGSGRT